MSMTKVCTTTVPAENVGVGDRVKIGRRVATVSAVVLHEIQVEITTNLYSEIKRDWVPTTRFYGRSVPFTVVES